jgi:hypothetical protein
MSGQNGERAVKLLQRQHAHQLVGQGHRAEGEAQAGLAAQPVIEPVGAADDEGRTRASRIALASEPRGEVGAGEVQATFVERDQQAAAVPGAYRRGFLGLAVLRPAGAAFGEFVQVRSAEAQRPGAVADAAGVTQAERALRAIRWRSARGA